MGIGADNEGIYFARYSYYSFCYFFIRWTFLDHPNHGGGEVKILIGILIYLVASVALVYRINRTLGGSDE